MKEITLSSSEFQSAAQDLMEISDNLSKLQPVKLSDFTPEETVVFSVDMNNGFAKFGALSSDRVKAIIPRTAEFVKRCIDSGVKVIAFTDTHESDSLEFGLFPPHCLIEDAESEYVEELSAIDRVYPKNSTNAFFSGGQELVSSDIKNYIITGCCTDICIFQFALSMRAYLNNINQASNVIVPLSLVETYDAPGHNAALFNLVFTQSMIQNGVMVVSDII